MQQTMTTSSNFPVLFNRLLQIGSRSNRSLHIAMFELFILPSATGRCTWHETRERKAAHAQVGVHRSHTCRRHIVSVRHPRTAR